MNRGLSLMYYFWALASSALFYFDYLSSSLAFEPFYWILLVIHAALIIYFSFRALLLVSIIGFVIWIVLLVGLIIPYDPNFSYGTHFQSFVHTEENVVSVFSSLGLAANIYWLVILSFVNRSELNPDFVRLNRERYLSSNINGERYIGWLLVFGAFVLVLTSEGWILFAPYPANKELWGFLDSGGVAILAPLSFVGALFIVRKYKVKPIFRLITYFALLIVAIHYLLAGDRGTFLIIFIGAISIYWFLLKHRSIDKALYIIILCIFSVRFLIHWGNVRTRAYYDGLLNSILQTYPSRYEGQFSVADFTLIPASFGHYLHAVDLYAQGVRLQGETFLALIPQMIPGFVARWLDYEIPLNSAWRLADYRINGGGMYIFAEAFWNHILQSLLPLLLQIKTAQTLDCITNP